MKASLLKPLYLFVLLCTEQFALADIPPALVEHCKKATALVVVDGNKGYGSAFCIDQTGIFVTNSHVVADNRSVSLVLSPGAKDQQVVKAVVVRLDKDKDLALLKVDRLKSPSVLALGDSVSVFETMEVAAFGFPFGQELAVSIDQSPDITVSLGHVTSLRKDRGHLKQIQLDASLNPGNSGGPVINNKGQVIGIVVSGIQGTGINFAIPVNSLSALLETPIIVLSPIDLSRDQQRQQQEFSIQLVPFRQMNADTTVDLILSNGIGDQHTYRAKNRDGYTYSVHAVPIPANVVSTLQVRTKTGASEAEFRVKDQTISVAGIPYRLAKIRSIFGGRQVTLENGERLAGTIIGLDAVETQIGGASARLNLTTADTVTIEETDVTAAPAQFRILVRAAGKYVSELAGFFGDVGAETLPGLDSSLHSMGGTSWRPISVGTGPAVTWKDQGPEIVLPASANGPIAFSGGFISGSVLQGDFDVQVDYRLLAWPESNGMRVGMRLTDKDGGEIGAVQRNNDGKSEQAVMTIFNRSGGGEDVHSRSCDSRSGRLRLTRKDGVLSGYLWDSVVKTWILINTGGTFARDARIYLLAWSDDNRYSHNEGHFLFTRFQVNRGQWDRK